MSQPAVSGTTTVQNTVGNITTKTITFTGAATLGAIGNLPVFTVTGGLVLVRYIAGRVTTSLVGAGATLALGTTNKTALFIAATAVAQLATATELWISTTGVQGGVLTNAAVTGAFIDENVVGTVASFALTAGVLEIDCLWTPLTSGATLA